MDFDQALKLLEEIEDQEAAASATYKTYIEEHKQRVKKMADWLLEKLPELFTDVDIEKFNELIENHDASKFSKEEFNSYRNKWVLKINDPLYDLAWEHHWKNNKHHPEFWQGKDIPYIYLLEMICDWGSFGIEKDLHELLTFYYTKARDDEEKNLSANTKKEVENILDKILDVIISSPLTETLQTPNSEIFRTKFLYHATFKPYWEDIKKEGFILPGKHSNWEELSKPDVICLARDEEVAESYCETCEDVPEDWLDEIVILQIDIDKLNNDKLFIDTNVYHDDDGVEYEYPETWQEFEYKDKIPTSAISKVLD